MVSQQADYTRPCRFIRLITEHTLYFNLHDLLFDSNIHIKPMVKNDLKNLHQRRLST